MYVARALSGVVLVVKYAGTIFPLVLILDFGVDGSQSHTTEKSLHILCGMGSPGDIDCSRIVPGYRFCVSLMSQALN